MEKQRHQSVVIIITIVVIIIAMIFRRYIHHQHVYEQVQTKAGWLLVKRERIRAVIFSAANPPRL